MHSKRFRSPVFLSFVVLFAVAGAQCVSMKDAVAQTRQTESSSATIVSPLSTKDDSCHATAADRHLNVVILQRGQQCVVSGGIAGRSTEIFFDAVRIDSYMTRESGPLDQVFEPVWYARQGKNWFFGYGLTEGLPFHDVSEHSPLIGQKYFVGIGTDGRKYRLESNKVGWDIMRIDDMVVLHDGSIAFVLTRPVDSAVYVLWGENYEGPYAHAKTLKHAGDCLTYEAAETPKSRYEPHSMGSDDNVD